MTPAHKSRLKKIEETVVDPKDHDAVQTLRKDHAEAKAEAKVPIEQAMVDQHALIARLEAELMEARHGLDRLISQHNRLK